MVLLIVAIFSMALVPAKAVGKSSLIKSMKFDNSSVNNYYQAVGGIDNAEKLLKQVASAKNETQALKMLESYSDVQKKAIIARFSRLTIEEAKTLETAVRTVQAKASSDTTARVINKKTYQLRENIFPTRPVAEFGTTDEITYKKNNKLISSRNISTTGTTSPNSNLGIIGYVKYEGIVSDNGGQIIENNKKFYHTAKGKFVMCMLKYGCIMEIRIWTKTWFFPDGRNIKESGTETYF